MIETESLLREIDGFLDEAAMSATTFGRLAVNDGKLVGRLRGGGSVTLRVAAKISAFISDRRAAVPARTPTPAPATGDAA